MNNDELDSLGSRRKGPVQWVAVLNSPSNPQSNRQLLKRHKATSNPNTMEQYGAPKHGVPGVHGSAALLVEAQQEQARLRGRQRKEPRDLSLTCLPQEMDSGNVEYKLRVKDANPTRIVQLTTQMQYRMSEGDGECFYYIGVEDKGYPCGLEMIDLEASIANLTSMAHSLHAVATLMTVLAGAHGRRCALLRVSRNTCDDVAYLDLRVAVAGGTDAGKSTLVAVLTRGCHGRPLLDSGRGSARMSVFRHKHEIQSGRTSSICTQTLGYDADGGVLNYAGVAAPTPAEISASSSRLLTFFDMGGAEKSLKTALYGMTCLLPDYTLLAVCAEEGMSHMGREHLAVALALEVPVVVVLTKTDLVGITALCKVVDDIRALVALALAQSPEQSADPSCPQCGSCSRMEPSVSHLLQSAAPVINTEAEAIETSERLYQLHARSLGSSHSTTAVARDTDLDDYVMVHPHGTIPAACTHHSIPHKPTINVTAASAGPALLPCCSCSQTHGSPSIIVPIFPVSCVSGAGLTVLHAFLKSLHPTSQLTHGQGVPTTATTSTSRVASTPATPAAARGEVAEQQTVEHPDADLGTPEQQAARHPASRFSTAAAAAAATNTSQIQLSSEASTQAAVDKSAAVATTQRATAEGLVHFQVDHTFEVMGVGSVVSGTLIAGVVDLGQQLLLGPTPSGGFQTVHVSSIQRSQIPVRQLRPGQTATIALHSDQYSACDVALGFASRYRPAPHGSGYAVGSAAWRFGSAPAAASDQRVAANRTEQPKRNHLFPTEETEASSLPAARCGTGGVMTMAGHRGVMGMSGESDNCEDGVAESVGKYVGRGARRAANRLKRLSVEGDGFGFGGLSDEAGSVVAEEDQDLDLDLDSVMNSLSDMMMGSSRSPSEPLSPSKPLEDMPAAAAGSVDAPSATAFPLQTAPVFQSVSAGSHFYAASGNNPSPLVQSDAGCGGGSSSGDRGSPAEASSTLSPEHPGVTAHLPYGAIQQAAIASNLVQTPADPAQQPLLLPCCQHQPPEVHITQLRATPQAFDDPNTPLSPPPPQSWRAKLRAAHQLAAQEAGTTSTLPQDHQQVSEQQQWPNHKTYTVHFSKSGRPANHAPKIVVPKLIPPSSSSCTSSSSEDEGKFLSQQGPAAYFMHPDPSLGTSAAAKRLLLQQQQQQSELDHPNEQQHMSRPARPQHQHPPQMRPAVRTHAHHHQHHPRKRPIIPSTATTTTTDAQTEPAANPQSVTVVTAAEPPRDENELEVWRRKPKAGAAPKVVAPKLVVAPVPALPHSAAAAARNRADIGACHLATSPPAPAFLSAYPPNSRKGAVLLDPSTSPAPQTFWEFEAVLVLLGGRWPARGLVSGHWPPTEGEHAVSVPVREDNRASSNTAGDTTRSSGVSSGSTSDAASGGGGSSSTSATTTTSQPASCCLIAASVTEKSRMAPKDVLLPQHEKPTTASGECTATDGDTGGGSDGDEIGTKWAAAAQNALQDIKPEHNDDVTGVHATEVAIHSCRNGGGAEEKGVSVSVSRGVSSSADGAQFASKAGDGRGGAKHGFTISKSTSVPSISAAHPAPLPSVTSAPFYKQRGGEFVSVVHCGSVRQSAQLVSMQELPEMASAVNTPAAAATKSSGASESPALLTLPNSMRAAAALLHGSWRIPGGGVGFAGASNGPDGSLRRTESDVAAVGGAGSDDESPFPQATAARQESGCLVKVKLRFVHRPEWLKEGSRLIVRDRGDGHVAGAGFVLRLMQ